MNLDWELPAERLLLKYQTIPCDDISGQEKKSFVVQNQWSWQMVICDAFESCEWKMAWTNDLVPNWEYDCRKTFGLIQYREENPK